MARDQPSAVVPHKNALRTGRIQNVQIVFDLGSSLIVVDRTSGLTIGFTYVSS
jgi:hypothetical protein